MNDATPSLSTGSYEVAPPTKLIENETSGRSCFSVTTRSAPFESFVCVQAGTLNVGALPAGGVTFRSSFACALRLPAHTRNVIPTAMRRRLSVAAEFWPHLSLPTGLTLAESERSDAVGRSQRRRRRAAARRCGAPVRKASNASFGPLDECPSINRPQRKTISRISPEMAFPLELSLRK